MAIKYVFAALALAVVAQAAIEEDEGVLVLDDENFDAAIKEHNPLLVEFYAPWCGHCKTLAPQYAKAAQQLKSSNLRLAKLDATVNKEAASRFGVQGFPTLKFFRGSADSVSDYNGPREADGIVGWMKKKAGPAALVLATAEEAAEFAKKNEVSILGFFAAGSAGEKAFATASASNDEVAFATSSSDAVRALYGVAAGEDAVVQLNTWVGEENKVTFTGEVTSAPAISSFVEGNSLPSVVAFTPDSAPKIFRGTIKTHFLLFADPAVAGYKELLATFRGVSATGKGKALFVTVDPSQDRVIGYFGVTAADFPTAVLVTMPEGEAMKKFAFPKAEKELSESNLSAFLSDFTAGKLKAHLKSEAVPTGEEEAPVKTVVGLNFESIVLDTTKDVLLEFYAPWCGHCKSLAPEWEKLGQKIKDAGAAASSVVIAKMDATANEVDFPGVNVKGFPTILYFPSCREGEAKRVVEYDGSRDMDGFVEFLRKNAVTPFRLADEGDLDL